MSAKKYAIPTPVQFDRLYAGPLDKHEVFDSYSEALTYAQGPISYPGQTIGVKKSGLKEDVYVINQDKSLSRLMIQREDIRLVLKKDNWVGEVPYEQTLIVPYLEATDNCIISLGESVTDPAIVREIVNAKIGDTIQEEGSIRFIARGDKPTIDIPITITIGSVVSAVEIPNNVNDNTNHTVVIAKKDAWVGDKPPYTQDLYVFGVRPDSNGTIGINPDSSYYRIDSAAAASAGVQRYSQRNNYVTIVAMNSKPTRDLEVLVVWGDEIVVWENSDTFEDFNTSLDLVLKANEWSNTIPYTQTLRVEGLSEYHTGAVGLSSICTPEEAEAGLNADLELIEQGNGYVIIRANDIKPTIDIPIYLTYGSNITIVPSPEYVGEANRHVDTMAYASRWTKTPDGWQQEVDVEGITSNSIGTMGLRNGATELQTYNAAVARIKITKVYDNKVILTATRIRPTVNIPLSFVFGRNINIAKYPGLIGKVSLDTNYITFDDSLINSGLSTVQQLLEHLYKTKVGFVDVIDSLYDNRKTYPLSANMGKELNEIKINYEDIVDTLYEEGHISNPENITSELHSYLPDSYYALLVSSYSDATITNISESASVGDIQAADATNGGIAIQSLGKSGIYTTFDLTINTSRYIEPNNHYLIQIKTNKTSDLFSIYDINPDNITMQTRDLARGIEPFAYASYKYGGFITNESIYNFATDNTWEFKTGNNTIDSLTINIAYQGLMSHNEPATMAEIRIFKLESTENTWESDKVLSARMGKFLSNSKINYTDIVDNVSTSAKYNILNSVTASKANVTTSDSSLIASSHVDSNNSIGITLNAASISGNHAITLNMSGFELDDTSVYILNIKPTTSANIKYQGVSREEITSSKTIDFNRYTPGSVYNEIDYGFNINDTWEIHPTELITDLNIVMKFSFNGAFAGGTFAEVTLFKLYPTEKVLSARMGNYLETKKINYVDTVDNLESYSKVYPLSANMGRQLKGDITKIENTMTSIGANDIVFKIQSKQPTPISGKNIIWIKI